MVDWCPQHGYPCDKCYGREMMNPFENPDRLSEELRALLDLKHREWMAIGSLHITPLLSAPVSPISGLLRWCLHSPRLTGHP